MSTNRQVTAALPRDPTGSDRIPAALRDTGREDRPAISVIIPVRNDPANLELCLRALDASEHPAYEVIVVDDASTDATPEVARRHGVRLLRLDTRSGPAAASSKSTRSRSSNAWGTLGSSGVPKSSVSTSSTSC